LLDLLFGCRHRHTSFPVSPAVKPGAPQAAIYIVCLDCGKHFQYDWEHMRVGAPIENRAPSKSPNPHSRTAMKYFVAVFTLPVVWLIAKAALGRTRLKPEKEQKHDTQPGKTPD